MIECELIVQYTVYNQVFEQYFSLLACDYFSRIFCLEGDAGWLKGYKKGLKSDPTYKDCK